MSERKRRAVTSVPAVRGPRHGLMALKNVVNLRGFHAVDRRTAGARHILKWRRELVRDLGGNAAISAAQGGLIEIAVRTRLLLDHCATR